MKKGVLKLTLFVLILSVLLCSGVFAVTSGKCAIVSKDLCDNPSTEGYVLMGLSALTNAHAQSWEKDAYNDYNYVLCCNFGDGNRGCTGTNKVVGISSFTNAHTESPSESNYEVNLCYEDLVCKPSQTGCTESLGMEIVNLSAPTNAHVGTGVGFQTAICCKSYKFLSACTLQSATWYRTEADDYGETEEKAAMKVVGSGQECERLGVSWEIWKKDGLIFPTYTLVASSPNTCPVDKNLCKTGFITYDEGTASEETRADSLWYADADLVEELTDGKVDGEGKYYFNVTLLRSIPLRSKFSSNALTVSRVDPETVTTASTCGDYTETDCEQDPQSVAIKSEISTELKCTDPRIECFCSWDDEDGCTLNYIEKEPGPCPHGFTLCTSPSLINYCFPSPGPTGACPFGTPPSDGIAGCGSDDSCASSDCKDGDHASCVLGANCKDKKCYTAGATIQSPLCRYGFTLCREPTSKANYCFPGADCPTNHDPFSDNDKECEVGEGCLSSGCYDGDQDSCTEDTYCSAGECGSMEIPEGVVESGECQITQTVTKECDEGLGYKTIEWKGVWTGEETTGIAYETCIKEGTVNVPCPAQVQLSFFDYSELVIAVAVIALIYLSLVFRRKFKRKK